MQKALLFKGLFKIKYHVKGSGNTIILLHGFTEYPGIWDFFVHYFSDKYKLIIPALPGHGGSDLIKPLSIETISEAIYEIILQENISKAVFVGHSMGGYVLLHLSEMHPKIFAGLCLLNSTALADTDQIRQNRMRSIEIINQNHHSFLNSFIPSLFAPSNIQEHQEFIQKLIYQAQQISSETLIACQKAMAERKDKTELLSELTFPIAFIFGKQDTRIQIQSNINQVIMPKNSYTLILENCGHMSYIEQQDKTIEFLDFFFSVCFKNNSL